MKNGKLKVFAAVLTMILALGVMGQADMTRAFYGAANPVPDVYERVCNSVVQVRGIVETWSRENGVANEVGAYGTGIYIEPGYVVTCWDIVTGVDSVEIETMDGLIVPAKNVYSDDSVDLSVIELEKPLEGVEPAVLGDSTALRPGELAIVIGTMMLDDVAFPGTLAVGFISGVDRSSDGMGSFTRSVPLIQMDIALNSGMSGAGLFNERGELVGLAALKGGLIDDMLYENLGFAIPSDTIERIAGDLIAHGVVRRPRMGVMVTDLDGPEEPIRTYPPCGLLVSEVEENGPAAHAGMMKYDIITEFMGERVHNFNELSTLLDACAAGDTVHVKVYRCLDEAGNMIEDPAFVELDIVLGILD